MTLLPKLSCLFSALNKYIDNLNHVAVNWKHGLFELCIFFLMLEHFPWGKISGLMIMEKKYLYIFLIKGFVIHTYTLITFSSFLAKVRHELLRKVFHPHFSGSFLVYLSTKQNVKGYISIKVIIFQSSLLLYTMQHHIEPGCYFLPDC